MEIITKNIRFVFTEPLLATLPGEKELLEKYIASNAPNPTLTPRRSNPWLIR